MLEHDVKISIRADFGSLRAKLASRRADESDSRALAQDVLFTGEDAMLRGVWICRESHAIDAGTGDIREVNVGAVGTIIVWF